MAGYRRVNYYELCRLCTSSEGTKMHIFREEGRRRQLPTKIQICLPLQVAEDDSLPKIICSQCVDKLESFYDFRESCVNAEAMLESYFTSLRYSNDFTREGKVYVKDESPPKKKAGAAGTEADKAGSPSKAGLPDGLNSLVQAAGIQIVTEEDASRVHQYKLQVEMAGAVLEAAAAERFAYDPATATGAATAGVEVGAGAGREVGGGAADGKLEDGSTQCSETDFTTKVIMQQRQHQHEQHDHQHDHQHEHEHEQQTPESSDADMSNQQALTFTSTDPGTNQMLVHFNFKERVDLDQRTSISQIGEFLRIKSVSPEAGSIDMSANQVLAPPSLATPTITCDSCHMLFATLEDFQNHRCCREPAGQDLALEEGCGEGGEAGADGIAADGKAGNFACEVCNKPFKRKEHLFQHRKLHSGERPYSCSACGKAFSRKEHLVRHAVSHTGQKTHACDLCGKAFSRKDNLHKHRKTHGIAGPYVCETCGKSFVVKHYYLVHQASHNDGGGGGGGGAEGVTVDVGAVAAPPQPEFKCDVCPKAFGSKTNLSAHKARHKKAEAAQQQLMSHLQPLTTINNAALHGAEVAQVAFLPDIIDQYRRMHST